MRRTERAAVVGFVLAMAIVSWGGSTLWRSMQSHRATADETLRDHASYIARNYSWMYGTETWYAVRPLLAAAERAVGSSGNQSVAAIIAAHAVQTGDDEPPPIAPLRFVVGDTSGWRTTSAGSEPDPELVARLDRRVGDSVPPKVSYRGTVVARAVGDTTIAIVARRRHATGWVGFEILLSDYRRIVLLPAPGRTQAFFDRVYDSLPEKRPAGVLNPIAVTVVTGDSIPLLTFNAPIEEGWTMGDVALPAFSAHLAVTVGPQAVPYLMPGGYPAAPGPRVAAVILLALLLLAGTAIIVWRTLSVSRMREDFTNAVSHELRTPLANIHLYAETLLLERVTEPAARRAALETITRETRRLGDMVENVLASARIARSEESLNPRPDQLGRIVHEVLDAFKPVLVNRRIAVDFDLVGDDTATIDADAVRRILVNLLDNAIRHGPDAQQLRIVVDHDGAKVLMIVQDEGPGIPERDRERVWEPFMRGASGGSGLGLAVVRHLARLHGGDATVGQGSSGARIEVRLATGRGGG